MEFTKYLEKLACGTTETEILETFVKEAMRNGDWIKDMGGEIAPYEPKMPGIEKGAGFPEISGSQYMDKWNIKGNPKTLPGALFWAFLVKNVKHRGINIIKGTPARELIQSEKGEIVGVIAERKGKTISIRAKKAVILTCGGYENDEFLKRDNFPARPVMTLGSPGNTGDGIRMAQEVGAGLWHMANLSSCIYGFKSPEYEAAFIIALRDPGFIYVDKNGKRFINERGGIESHAWGTPLSYFDHKSMDYPRIPMYAIFDKNNLKNGPLSPVFAGYNKPAIYRWSKDNSQEINKGWIVRSDSIVDLAGLIQVNESNLEGTIMRYNHGCTAGIDDEFGRTRQTLKAIEGPPYYAIALYPALFNTQGGPRRDKESRVLDPYGKPIKRLYAAGELGSILGIVYQGASSLTECLAFGRIAGRNAARERPFTHGPGSLKTPRPLR